MAHHYPPFYFYECLQFFICLNVLIKGLSSGSQPRVILLPDSSWIHLVKSGDIFDYHNWQVERCWHLMCRGQEWC